MEDFTEILAREKKSQDSGNHSNTTAAAPSEQAFKKPVIIGRRPGTAAPKLKPVAIAVVTEDASTQSNESVNTALEPTVDSPSPGKEPFEFRNDNKPQLKPNAPAPIPYKEPAWSGTCDKEYKLEILKTGTIVGEEDLTKKPYLVFGRLSNCDVLLEHPSASRFHAILQYRAEADEDRKIGWYLYDLGSTHGTFLNKKQLQPKIYYRVRVGYVIKFGGSTRLYILQGPDEDQEAESELSVTELIELRKKKEEIMNKLEEDEDDEKEGGKSDETARPQDPEKDGIDWGMKEDAAEENPAAENPFASELNEELYLEDPKKTLRGWFEREGQELEYKVEDRGSAHFVCRVELPVESATGQPLVAEAVVKGGKKKEVVVQCALEACRILDKHGLLRQATHESRQKRKRRYEDDDYYSSDEDTFLDRTGAVEKKRAARMKAAGVLGEEVDTYETLVDKYEQLQKEMTEVQRQLDEAARDASGGPKQSDADADSLDAYMVELTKQDAKKKKPTGKLKVRLSQLQQEELRLRKLINIAKPAALPELKAPVSVEPPVPETLPATLPQIPEAEKLQPEANLAPPKPKEELELKEVFEKPAAGPVKQQKPARKLMGPLLTPEIMEQFRGSPDDAESLKQKDESRKTKEIAEKDVKLVEEEPQSGLVIRKKEEGKKQKREKEKKSKKETEVKVEYNTSDTDKYSMWLPPDDQSGDGTTSLNKKLGY